MIRIVRRRQKSDWINRSCVRFLRFYWRGKSEQSMHMCFQALGKLFKSWHPVKQGVKQDTDTHCGGSGSAGVTMPQCRSCLDLVWLCAWWPSAEWQGWPWPALAGRYLWSPSWPPHHPLWEQTLLYWPSLKVTSLAFATLIFFDLASLGALWKQSLQSHLPGFASGCFTVSSETRGSITAPTSSGCEDSVLMYSTQNIVDMGQQLHSYEVL